MTPFLLVLSSPSGGGKTTIARRLLASRKDVGYSVSATTRAARTGEVNGKDYWFLTEPEFEAKVKAGDFVEHARYNDHRYGTLRSEVERLFDGGQHVVMDIEVNGARQVRRQFADAVLVFVLPPTGTELVRRLGGRGTEPAAVVKHRMEIASEELSAVHEYDYVVINDELEHAVATVSAIIDAEARRIERRVDIAAEVESIRREINEELRRLDG